MSVSDEVSDKVVFHEELCDNALKHYNEISTTAMHSSSLVPKAIEYYKRWVPTGVRKIFTLPFSLGSDGAQKRLDELADLLAEGWVFDPWLNSHGRLITPFEIGGFVILVKGTPEQIAGLEPFVTLPAAEEPVPEPESKPYGLETLFIAHGEKDDSGEPKKPPQGFVVMHKDHIFAKGTVYTKIAEKASQ